MTPEERAAKLVHATKGSDGKFHVVIWPGHGLVCQDQAASPEESRHAAEEMRTVVADAIRKAVAVARQREAVLFDLLAEVYQGLDRAELEAMVAERLEKG